MSSVVGLGCSDEIVRLWSADAPEAVGYAAQDIPTLSVYRPEAPNGSSIIVCPGGGYTHLAPHEAEPPARWLNALGVTAFVMKYRLGPRYRHPVPLLDAARGIRLVRAEAQRWTLDPNRIGILGFSAGGHLSAMISTRFDDGKASSPDPIDRVHSRPDLSILLYPVVTLSDPSAHAGSRRQLLGPDPSPSLIDDLSCELHVTPRTPPAFLFHTADDPSVSVQNSLMYASALSRAGVPFELHVYEGIGRHGVGMAESDPILRTWSVRCAAWLAKRGFCRT